MPGSFQGWKTVSAAGVMLLAVLTDPAIQDLISEYPRIYHTVFTVIVIALRVMTKTPIGQAAPPPTPEETPK